MNRMCPRGLLGWRQALVKAPGFITGGVGPPLWREARFGLETAALLRDPILRGDGVPDGRGRPVLLIPGFLAGDGSLAHDGRLAEARRLPAEPGRHARERRLLGRDRHAARGAARAARGGAGPARRARRPEPRRDDRPGARHGGGRTSSAAWSRSARRSSTRSRSTRSCACRSRRSRGSARSARPASSSAPASRTSAARRSGPTWPSRCRAASGSSASTRRPTGSSTGAPASTRTASRSRSTARTAAWPSRRPPGARSPTRSAASSARSARRGRGARAALPARRLRLPGTTTAAPRRSPARRCSSASFASLEARSVSTLVRTGTRGASARNSSRVGARQVGDRAQHALAPEQLVRERRDVAHVDAAADDAAALRDARAAPPARARRPARR